jgi:hypothetical protein
MRDARHEPLSLVTMRPSTMLHWVLVSTFATVVIAAWVAGPESGACIWSSVPHFPSNVHHDSCGRGPTVRARRCGYARANTLRPVRAPRP